MDHKWNFTFEKPPVNPAAKTLYDFHPHLDEDVHDSLHHTYHAEHDLNYKWDITAPDDDSEVQVNSDPICSSAGCGQYKHPSKPRGYPIDYPVPSFGRDPDIMGAENSLAVAED